MGEQTKSVDVLILNAKALLRAKNWTLDDLAKKSGVSRRMIGYIFSKDRTPTTEVVDKIAEAFGVEPWQLTIPNISINEINPDKISALVHHYANSEEPGREYIERVAEKEANYKK